MHDLTAVIMAAGRGVRMRSRQPKVLHPVAGAPLVRHVVDAVGRLEPQALVVVVPADGAHAVLAAAGGAAAVHPVEQSGPLGTGHALTAAIPHLPPESRYLLLLNGDTPLLETETLRALVQAHQRTGAVLTVLSMHLGPHDAQDLGRIVRDAQGRPVAIVEAAEAAGDSAPPSAGTDTVEVNVGAYCIDVAWVRHAVRSLAPRPRGETYVTDLVAVAAAEGASVEAVPLASADEGTGVNTRAQLARAERLLQERLRERWMHAGVTLVDPATAFFDVDVTLEEDVTVHPNTQLRGGTSVGAGTAVGPNAYLLDTHVGRDCRIGESRLDGAVLEEGVTVGPYCHLRPGTHLERGAHVGSHVELKNSRIGAGSHVGHFSYIGDATLGRGVNIGAGTVTCNFDGVAKHETAIGDGAFIGSSSLLVAPVRIGARALTGAGTVVTRDVPEGARAVGVPARLLPERAGAPST